MHRSAAPRRHRVRLRGTPAPQARPSIFSAFCTPGSASMRVLKAARWSRPDRSMPRPFGPAQRDVEVRVGEAAEAGDPLLARELAVGDLEHGAHALAGGVLDGVVLGFLADEVAGAEQRLEGRVHVRVDVGQPARGLAALSRAAVAGQSRLGVGVGDVAHDRGVLGQHEVAVDDGRDRAGGVDRRGRRAPSSSPCRGSPAANGWPVHCRAMWSAVEHAPGLV